MNELNAKLRGLEIPERMRRLPIDERGWLVPWFVAWPDGKSDHRTMDSDKLRVAIKLRRCWLCGDPLGARGSFVIGPMCAINRTNGEPPSHHDCATFAAISCPFLTQPRAQRRGDPQVEYVEQGAKPPAGFAILRNPGAVAVWTSKRWSIFKAGHGGAGILFDIGDPERVEWYCRGRAATRAEVEASIESGTPLLLEKAEEQERLEPGCGALKALRRELVRVGPYLPRGGAPEEMAP